MKKQHINIRVTEEQKNIINELKGEKTITDYLMQLVEERNELGRNDKGGGKSRTGRLQTEREN